MNIFKIIKISRPISWPVFLFIVFMGIKFSGAELTFTSIIQLISFTFPFNFFAYGINDIFDIKTDRLNPRKKSEISGAKITAKDIKQIKIISVVCVLFVLSASILTKNIQNIFLTSLLIVATYFYSAPPVRLKERPPFDSVANGIGYVFLPAAIGFSYGNPIFSMPSSAYFVVLCAIAVHAFSTAVDYVSDKKAGIKTFAVVFGRKKTMLFALFLMVISALFANIDSLILNSIIY